MNKKLLSTYFINLNVNNSSKWCMLSLNMWYFHARPFNDAGCLYFKMAINTVYKQTRIWKYNIIMGIRSCLMRNAIYIFFFIKDYNCKLGKCVFVWHHKWYNTYISLTAKLLILRDKYLTNTLYILVTGEDDA